MARLLRAYRTMLGMSFGVAPVHATLFLLCGVFMALFTPISSYGAKVLVDAVVARNEREALVAAAILSLFAALSLINVLFYVDFLFTVAERTGAAIDRRLMALVSGIPGLEHHERPEYIDRMDTLREERPHLPWMTNATAGMVRVAVQLGATGILLARLDPLLLLLPLAGFASFALSRKAEELRSQALEETAQTERLRRHLFDTATNAGAGKELRIFDLTGDMVQRHHDVSGRVHTVRDAADWRGAGLQAIDGLISGAAYVAAIGLVLYRAVHGNATPGDVVLAVGLAAGMNSLVITAVLYGASFVRVLRAAERFLWLADYAETARRAAAGTASVPSAIRDGVRLRDVSFRYPGTERAILDRVTLDLPPGAVVALVGENGAGKTTLAKLLARFYEPDAGTIEVDGKPLVHLDLDAWRARIAAAFQDFARFEFSIGETVGVGDLPRIDDECAVTGAVQRAGATDVVERFPDGLSTQLGTAWNGAELSGGQWQKLAVGRAMMREAPLLLILDEPTAALDAQTEHLLFERYAALARDEGASAGTITLLVSHRFSTVRMADLILVLHDGRIAEHGNHSELMDRNGLYAELYELQARAYR